jgi:hypothetical protein
MNDAWRLHLTNRTIQRVDFLPGSPALLAVWTRADRVAYYRVETGDRIGEARLIFPKIEDRTSLEWQNFVDGLHAPNGAPLPFVQTDSLGIYNMTDRNTRVYRLGDRVIRQHGTTETQLGLPPQLAAVQPASGSGRVYALGPDGRLYIDDDFPLPTGLNASPRYGLAVASEGDALFASDGWHITALDHKGSQRVTTPTSYLTGLLVCSPKGAYVATQDVETGVVRVFDGVTLRQIYQRFAIDLVLAARRLQLLEDLPPVTAALGTMTINDDGVLAFGMSGSVCLSHVTRMSRIPAPQAQV